MVQPLLAPGDAARVHDPRGSVHGAGSRLAQSDRGGESGDRAGGVLFVGLHARRHGVAGGDVRRGREAGGDVFGVCCFHVAGAGGSGAVFWAEGEVGSAVDEVGGGGLEGGGVCVGGVFYAGVYGLGVVLGSAVYGADV